MWMEADAVYFNDICFCSDVLRKIMEHLSKDWRLPGRDSNIGRLSGSYNYYSVKFGNPDAVGNFTEGKPLRLLQLT
jgi:hypothetical protein